ncbi:MAG: ABC transporter permease [Peptostreptococcaceae bacterium]
MDKNKLNKPMIIGIAILLSFIFVAIFAEKLMPFTMKELNAPYLPPSKMHLLGTNDIGQDIFSELLLGTRVSLIIGIFSSVIIVIVGTILGVLAGYCGGKVDKVISAMITIFMSIPQLPLTIVLVAYLNPSIWNIIIAICITAWTSTARIIRSKVMELKELPFIKIEKTLGQSNFIIMAKHILPNIIDIILVRGTLAVASAMLTEASLSFLGLGVYNQKSWGAILHYAFFRHGVTAGYYWWYVPPILCTSICIFAFMLIGYYGIGSESDKSSYEQGVLS